MLKRALLTLGLIAATAAVAVADPFEAKTVPADAKWVVHLDVDAIAASAFWPLIEQKINADTNLQNGLQQFEMMAGMMVPQDLHAVTLYGRGFDGADVVIIAKARANQRQLLTMLQANPSFASAPHGSHQIISWEDKGKVIHGAFFSSDRAVIAQSNENVGKALDILDGKGEALKAGSALALPTGTGMLAGLASDSVTSLAKKPENQGNPVFANLTSACITLTEQAGTVTAKGAFGTADEARAQQLKTVADGFKALGVMLAVNENTDPKLKALAPLLPSLEIAAQDTRVMLCWPVPFTQVKALVNQLQDANGKKKRNEIPDDRDKDEN